MRQGRIGVCWRIPGGVLAGAFQSPYNFLSVPADNHQRPEYAFGSFRLTSSILELNGRLLPLSPKAIDTLYFLVSRAPEIVTKEDLIAAVWPDPFVVESRLARDISLIRKALEENGGPGPRIETIPKRGYRFVAPLESLTDRKPTSPDVLEAIPADPVPADPKPADVSSTPGSERRPESAGASRSLRIRAAVVVLAGLAWLAARQFRSAKAQPPFDASTRIARHLLLKASPEEVRRALEWFEAAVAVLGRFREAKQHMEQARLHPSVLRTDRAWLGMLEGKRQLAEEVYSETLASVTAGRYGPSSIVLLAVALGKTDEAMTAIEKETNRDRTALLEIQGDLRLEAMRNDPRFQALVAGVFGTRTAP